MDIMNIRTTLEHVRGGRVEHLSHIPSLSQRDFRVVTATAAQCGQIEVLCMCAATTKWMGDVGARCASYIGVCANGQLETFKFLVSIATHDHLKGIANCVYSAAVICEQKDIIEYWMSLGHGDGGMLGQFSYSLGIHTAIEYGNWKMLEWLISNGIRCTIESIEMRDVSNENRIRVLQVLHEHRFYGVYEDDCNSGVCKVCLTNSLWDVWKMDTDEFTKNMQWLPREMVEDVVMLCFV